MKRSAEFKQDDNGIGTWQITCDDCPLRPHLEALDLEHARCLSGVETNMQGFIILGSCKHMGKGSADRTDAGLTIDCGCGDVPA